MGRQRRRSAEDIPHTIFEQIDVFEQQNPEIAAALRLFDMTMASYEGALHAMANVRISRSNSSVEPEVKHRGKVESTGQGDTGSQSA